MIIPALPIFAGRDCVSPRLFERMFGALRADLTVDVEYCNWILAPANFIQKILTFLLWN